jgi:hypothetical protein
MLMLCRRTGFLTIVLLLSVVGSVTEAEMQQAEDKFEESRQLAEAAMHNLIENEVSLLVLCIP